MKLTKSRLTEIIKEELTEARRVQLQIPIRDRKKVDKILKKSRGKEGKHFDYGVGRGSTFILDLDKKFQNKFLELLVKNRIQVKEL